MSKNTQTEYNFLKQSLDTRMKIYEKAAEQQFSSRNTIIVRVDGVAFHTFTRGANKPFDEGISKAMQYATYSVHDNVQGCVLAYTQSDEATFLITDLTGKKSQGWFGFKKFKLESVIASMFTYYFNTFLNTPYRYNPKPDGSSNPAFFDARAFSVPAEDAPNVFVWRQKDAYRNYIQSVARAEFGHKAIQGKSTAVLENQLWANYDPTWLAEEYKKEFAFGVTFYESGQSTKLMNYEEFMELATTR